MSSMPSTVVAVPGMHILPRVLVIAEDRSAQRSPQRLLESDGYDVAGCGEEAADLELLRDTPLVAVVLDLNRRSSCARRARSQSSYWAPCWSQTVLLELGASAP